ncbi:hypothetical protein Glove_86g218 [Diversispora epigaea]|uniref:Sel1 repeat family protein n=1 Tax=Diversispora epigaea TaxID=1348612 RepID=A0A397JG19_9GLOM|nr:hypothetical protein Glove_86g218 [Diversispora epigaea]
MLSLSITLPARIENPRWGNDHMNALAALDLKDHLPSGHRKLQTLLFSEGKEANTTESYYVLMHTPDWSYQISTIWNFNHDRCNGFYRNDNASDLVCNYCPMRYFTTTIGEEAPLTDILRSQFNEPELDELVDHLQTYLVNNDARLNFAKIYRTEKTFQWYLKSAEGRDSDGQNSLGYYYQHDIGTIKNEKKFQWYMKSAKEEICMDNLMKAFQWYLNLGYCYNNGIGTIKDDEKAFQRHLKSAEGETGR